MNELLHLDLGDDIDLRTPEGREAVRELLEQDVQDDDEDDRDAKVQATQARLEMEIERHAVRVREAFDEIAAGLERALSQDRDLDEEGRQARTELMQRADAARESRHFPELLAIRLELEKRGLAEHFSEKQMTECNKLLKEELRLVEFGTAAYARILGMERPELSLAQLTPEMPVHIVKNAIVELREHTVELDRELTELQDTDKLKAWLEHLDDMEDE